MGGFEALSSLLCQRNTVRVESINVVKICINIQNFGIHTRRKKVPTSGSPKIPVAASRSEKIAGYVLIAWLLGGTVGWVICLDLGFRPSSGARWLIGLTSLLVGGGAFLVALSSKKAQVNLRKFGAARRLVAIAIGLIVMPFIGLGFPYLVVYAVHSGTGTAKDLTVTISSKNTNLPLPGRCSHYLRLEEMRFPFLRYVCVTPEQYELVSAGDIVLAPSTVSLVGLRHHSLSLGHK